MMTIFVEDSFEAAHRLPNVPDGHKCAAVHGHRYEIRIEVTGAVGEHSGWVIDYAYLKDAWWDLHRELDHHYLNDVDGLQNPTCENIALWIRDRLLRYVGQLSRIELRETGSCGVVLTVGQ